MLSAMDWFAIEIRATLACEQCGARVALLGLRAVPVCPTCAAPIELATLELPYRLLGGEFDAPTEALVRDGKLRARVDVERAQVHVRRAPLACACGAALPRPEQGRYVKCEACGDAVPVRWPDDETRLWDGRPWCIVGDAAAITSKGPQMIDRVLCCKSCAQPLGLSGMRRALACVACGAANFIGDAVWSKLVTDHAFWLVYKLDDRVTAAARKFAAGTHAGLTEGDVANLLARLDTQRLEDALAGHGRIDVPMARILLERELSLEQLQRIASWLSPDDRVELGPLAARLPE